MDSVLTLLNERGREVKHTNGLEALQIVRPSRPHPRLPPGTLQKPDRHSSNLQSSSMRERESSTYKGSKPSKIQRLSDRPPGRRLGA